MRILSAVLFHVFASEALAACGNLCDSSWWSTATNADVQAELNAGAVSTLVGVSDSSSLFLQHLEKRNLKLGTTIEIVNHFEFDRSLSILVNGSEQNISQRVADNLIVQPK